MEGHVDISAEDLKENEGIGNKVLVKLKSSAMIEMELNCQWWVLEWTGGMLYNQDMDLIVEPSECLSMALVEW